MFATLSSVLFELICYANHLNYVKEEAQKGGEKNTKLPPWHKPKPLKTDKDIIIAPLFCRWNNKRASETLVVTKRSKGLIINNV